MTAGSGFQPVVVNGTTHRARRRATPKPKSQPQVLLGEPHLPMFAGDDLAHAIWRREMQREIWGPAS